VQRFYWLEEGRLAGCSRPGLVGYTEDDASTAHDVHWLRGQGIGALLSLTETPIPAVNDELIVLHLPVPDMRAPNADQLGCALAFLDRQWLENTAVAVHCKMGQGRTGTILAAHLIRRGAGTDEAIARIRALCSGAIESSEQVAALHAFEHRRDWIL
jgi:atypical dual specificity phosphatase